MVAAEGQVPEKSLLAQVMTRNPQLIEAAIELHQSGAIPAATYLLDLDAIAHNTAAMAAEAAKWNLRVYLMTKQNGRNPFLAKVGLAQGIPGIVAVEAIEAHVLDRYGLPVSHVGHLSNTPTSQVRAIVAMHPDAVTVYTLAKARQISEAARELGVEQALYVRVNRVGDEIFRGMVGGWDIETCVEEIRPILDLPNVRLAGLTMHPVISYTNTDAYAAQPNNAFFTMIEAKEKLERAFGLRDLRVNCAANANCVTFGTLAKHGATDVEPGMGITGSSLFHAYQDLPELPAQVYVSEVTHDWAGEVYVLGGGLAYIETFGHVHEDPPSCLVGKSSEQARETAMTMRFKGVIDYHVACSPPSNRRPMVGETVVFALHPQFFVNRCYVAAVSSIAQGQPKVEGLFDCAGTELGPDFRPIAFEDTIRRADQVAARYALARA